MLGRTAWFAYLSNQANTQNIPQFLHMQDKYGVEFNPGQVTYRMLQMSASDQETGQVFPSHLGYPLSQVPYACSAFRPYHSEDLF